MAKIKIENDLLEKIKEHVETAGYSSVEEFVTHTLEKEIEKFIESESDNEMVTNRLKGLGYLE